MRLQARGYRDNAYLWLLRSDDPRNRGDRDPDRRSGSFEGFDGDPLVCRRCGQQITSTAQRININGAHQHTFANPEGMLFDIGCFGSIRGCLYCGEPTDQWTWFRGYMWRVIYCRECNLHLGWCFTSGAHVFHGLVLHNLSRLS